MNQNRLKTLIRCNKNIRRILVWIITGRFCPHYIACRIVDFLYDDDKEL